MTEQSKKRIEANKEIAEKEVGTSLTKIVNEFEKILSATAALNLLGDVKMLSGTGKTFESPNKFFEQEWKINVSMEPRNGGYESLNASSAYTDPETGIQYDIQIKSIRTEKQGQGGSE